MNRQAGAFCTALFLVSLALPAAAQSSGAKTRILRESPHHTTIVIHDNSPEAYARQRDAAVRAQQAREAEAQRKHELEVERIRADAQVRVARAQQRVAPAPTPAPAPVREENKKASFRNGGRFTGFSDVYLGGFYGGLPVYGYGYGYGGGGYGYGYGRACGPGYGYRSHGRGAYHGGGHPGGGYRGGGGRGCR